MTDLETRITKNYAPTFLELMVLAAIRKKGSEFVDRASIIDVLDKQARFQTGSGSVAEVLKRLEREGLVFRTDDTKRIGESWVFYTLTEEGQDRLTRWLDQVIEMI